MLAVRLARFGTKKRPYYHVVVTDRESPRDGRYIEHIGTYDPVKPMADARIDHDRYNHWFKLGARPSESLAKVLREHKKALEKVAKSA